MARFTFITQSKRLPCCAPESKSRAGRATLVCLSVLLIAGSAVVLVVWLSSGRASPSFPPSAESTVTTLSAETFQPDVVAVEDPELTRILQELPREPEKLIRILQSEERPRYRTAAAVLLSCFPGNKQVTTALREAIKDEDDEVAGSAACSLLEVGREQAPLILAGLLEEDLRTAVKVEILRRLTWLEPSPEGVVPSLRKLLEGGPLEVQLWARAAIVMITGKADNHVEALTEVLRDGKRERLHGLCLTLLSDLGEAASEAVPAVLERLQSDDFWIRFHAARAIGEIGVAGDAAIGSLLKVAQDPGEDVDIRIMAIRSLGGLEAGKTEVVDRLIEISSDENPGLQMACAAALVRIAPADRKVHSHLRTVMKDREPGVRRAPIRSLQGIELLARELLPFIYQALYDEDSLVRFEAMQCLTEAREPSEDIVPMLLEVLQPGGEFRASAAKALGKHTYMQDQIVQALIVCLEDEDWALVEGAVASLGQMGPAAREAIPALELTRERYRQYRQSLSEAPPASHEDAVPVREVAAPFLPDRIGKAIQRIETTD